MRAPARATARRSPRGGGAPSPRTPRSRPRSPSPRRCRRPPRDGSPLRDRERPDRQRQVEVAVRIDPADRSHRRAAPDRLERCDVVDGGDLGRTRDRSAREGRPRISARPTPGRRRPSTVVTHVRDARELALFEQLRPANGSRARRRARGRSAPGRRSSRARRRPSRSRQARRGRRAGRVPLIGFVQTRSPAPREEELGRGRDDRPATAQGRSPWSGAERREAGQPVLLDPRRRAQRGAGRD